MHHLQDNNIIIFTLYLHPAHDGLISDRYQSVVILSRTNKNYNNNSTIYNVLCNNTLHHIDGLSLENRLKLSKV